VLGYYAASSGNFLPTFQDILSGNLLPTFQDIQSGPIFKGQESKK
jgi:hypothetical protein